MSIALSPPHSKVPNGELPATNAPFHTLETASAHSIARQGRGQMFLPLPPKIYKVVQDQWTISWARVQLYHTAIRLNQTSITQISLPELKTIVRTPLPSESNVGTGTKLCDDAVFFSWLPNNGTLSQTTNGMVEFICDYANRWHSALPSTNPEKVTPNRHLPGTVPVFAYLPTHFDKFMKRGPKHAATELSKRFSREAFWQLRYLFVIVQSGSDNPTTSLGHVAVCVISPEAKTIDFLCSGGDDGLIRGKGAQCVEPLIGMLAEYLGDQPPLAQRFNPCDWKLGTDRSELQDMGKPDCGMYVISNIMCLAFGWDLSWGARGELEIRRRRKRLVADLFFGGFRGYNPDENADNTHYYPLNNLRPQNSLTDNFIPILEFRGLLISETLTPEVRRRSSVYYGCPDKETLYEHCRRNKRFYPNFDSDAVSGPNVSFTKLLSWVERYDEARDRKVAPLPKPYLKDGSNGNKVWISPDAIWPTEFFW